MSWSLGSPVDQTQFIAAMADPGWYTSYNQGKSYDEKDYQYKDQKKKGWEEETDDPRNKQYESGARKWEDRNTKPKWHQKHQYVQELCDELNEAKGYKDVQNWYQFNRKHLGKPSDTTYQTKDFEYMQRGEPPQKYKEEEWRGGNQRGEEVVRLSHKGWDGQWNRTGGDHNRHESGKRRPA